MEEKGECFTGTTIKDTWTITRGMDGKRGGTWGSQGWGEKAENCT